MISSSAAANNRLNSYTYDSAGNVTYDGTHHYTYDAYGRVLEVDGGTTASYVYNENGQRVRKNTGSTWTEYFYGPGGNVQSEYNGTWKTQYVYIGSRLIAGYAQGTTAFDFTDQLGSTRLVTAVNRSIVDNMDYEPFGQQTAGGSITTHKFTGKERDAESGLDYFGARYYTSAPDRWVSPDPSGLFFADAGNPQSLNLYAYVQNMPVEFEDPDGLRHLPPVFNVGWALGLWWDIEDFFKGLGGGGGAPSPFGGLFPNTGWTTHPPGSGHYLAVGVYPPGAGWLGGHLGDSVDKTKTNGWATQVNATLIDRMAIAVGVPFEGMERSDHRTYRKHLSGFGHPLYLYHSITDQAAATIKERINERYDPRYGLQHNYELFLNNCVQQVEGDIRAGNISGGPPSFLFSPWLAYFWLRVQAQ